MIATQLEATLFRRPVRRCAEIVQYMENSKARGVVRFSQGVGNVLALALGASEGEIAGIARDRAESP
jgi:hypothetical protein